MMSSMDRPSQVGKGPIRAPVEMAVLKEEFADGADRPVGQDEGVNCLVEVCQPGMRVLLTSESLFFG